MEGKVGTKGFFSKELGQEEFQRAHLLFVYSLLIIFYIFKIVS